MINAGNNGLFAAVSASNTNGVTGVKTGTSPLDIPCGVNGYVADADWYFPTQADGRIAANAVIWMQHGSLEEASTFAALATQLARETNSIVVAPTITSFETTSLPGCFLGSPAMQAGAADMFFGDRAALTISATAAGYQGRLPGSFLLAGHLDGGAFAAAVGALTVDNGAATNLLGVVMVDGVADEALFAISLAKLSSLGIPMYQIAGSPGTANGLGRTAAQLALLMPDQFIGVQIDTSASDGLLSRAGARDTATFAVGWINDLYAAYGPTNPRFGIYGSPNDGTYVPSQPIVIGRGRATVLPILPPV